MIVTRLSPEAVERLKVLAKQAENDCTSAVVTPDELAALIDDMEKQRRRAELAEDALRRERRKA